MSAETKVKVIVLGAGVLGLSIAKELAEKGVSCAVVARDLPEDLESGQFASPWAGANWSSFAAEGSREAHWDTVTFHHYAQLSQSHPHVVERRPFKRFWNKEGGYPDPWFKDLVFGFRSLEQDELAPGYKYGQGYECYTMSPPAYLGYLAEELRSYSVPLIRRRVSSLDEAYSMEDIGPVDLVINATGLGSRSLLGVEDELVYPIRGDTVLIRAPGIKTTMKVLDPNSPQDQQLGKRFYIIPRPGPGDRVILGGTELDNDWDTLPRPETAKRILRDAYAVCPELSGGKGWEAIDVISCNAGLRPARKGGARVELEYRRLGEQRGLTPHNIRSEENVGREVGVVHAYGIGPAGYQTSKGISEEVTGLVDKFFRDQNTSISGISNGLENQHTQAE
ncbi:hypothetical protein BD324DRAFT_624309 [Kockovaella imperatae]|uniref:FAD dependent oxidoreductase domain-containing protein n=1 Tax=Kockovaella imperatae TaxID=4999 RepID=A0A1Y1UJ96_9TREE|nr:hypothetical protein BD324DRAFT_624309 [Kockovaella imperatae]ORX38052.1 hypothetical protein BD324DRAFT_624309 [Kockovaella imperatae]